MQFGALGFGLAFLGVALPVIIHLWSKKTRKKVPFGSVKFLTETDTRTLKQILPSELLLLLLRVLIISTFALILMDPKTPATESSEAYFIDPDYRNNEAFRSLIDTLDPNTTFWLAPGFPQLKDSISWRKMSLWSIYQNLPIDIYSSINILSPLRIKNFEGESSSFGKINFIQLPHASSKDYLATYDLKNSIRLTYSLRSSKKYSTQKNLLLAAIQAINSNKNIELIESENDAVWKFWLRDDEPMWDKNLIYLEKNQIKPLLKISPSVYAISEGLTAEEILEEDFVLRLEQILLKDQSDYEDLRVLPLSQIPLTQKLQTSNQSEVQRWKSASNWFWGLLAFLILLERIVAFRSIRN